MIDAAIFLGALAAALNFSVGVYALVLAPTLFMACDFAEDVMLSRFLVSPTRVTEEAVAVAKATTNAKIATCSIAIFQTMVVSALGLFL